MLYLPVPYVESAEASEFTMALSNWAVPLFLHGTALLHVHHGYSGILWLSSDLPCKERPFDRFMREVLVIRSEECSRYQW